MDSENYPLSSPKGDAIPFDIGFPKGLWIAPVAVAASAAQVLPSDSQLVVLYATVDTVVLFSAAGDAAVKTQSTNLPLTVFIPAGGLLSILLPDIAFSTISANGISVGSLYVQLFSPWQSIGKDLLTRAM